MEVWRIQLKPWGLTASALSSSVASLAPNHDFLQKYFKVRIREGKEGGREREEGGGGKPHSGRPALLVYGLIASC